jgi:hypothetical protein
MLQACAWLDLGGAQQDSIDASLVNTEQAVQSLLAGRDLDPIEGTWEHDHDSFEIVIARNDFHFADEFDYVGVITRSDQPRWQPGDVKLLLKKANAEREYLGVWTTYNKSKRRMRFVIEDRDLIQASFTGQDGNPYYVRIRRVGERLAARY